jgi:hypothetical protein
MNDVRDDRDGARGRWLVLGIVALALILALVGLRYRKLAPRRAPAATQSADVQRADLRPSLSPV